MLKKLEPLKKEPKVFSRTPLAGPAPDLRYLKPNNNTNIQEKNPKLRALALSPPARALALSPILSQKDKVHHKFKSEYNAFMNSFRPSDSVLEHSDPCDKELKIQNLKIQSISKTGVEHNVSELRSKHIIQPQNLQIFPKDCSNNLEQSSEIIPLSKKEVIVWKDGIQIPYKTFRQGPMGEDGIIFVLPPLEFPLRPGDLEFPLRPGDLEQSSEDTSYLKEGYLDEKNYLFIGYSKKQLYEEYMTVGHDTFFILDIIEEESYYIPMHQIVRILEYSHPMYLIEKSNTSAIQDDSYICFAKPAKF